MSPLILDVRQSLRSLLRNPGFTLGVVLVLALGIGTNTAVFSIVNAFLLRPLPFNAPDELVHVWETKTLWESEELRVSVPDFLDFRAQNTTLEDLGGYYYGSSVITSSGDPLRVQVTNVTHNLIDLLGVEPVLGRNFAAQDGEPGHEQVVLLNHRYWKRHLNSDPNVVGSVVTLDGFEHIVVGVMPESFEFPLKATMMWKPLPLTGREWDRDPGGPLLVVGRMKDGVTMAAAQADLETIAQRLAALYPDTNGDVSVNVVPLRRAMVFFYDLLRQMFLLIFLATGFVTLIVCANVGNLLLARSMGRSREVAIRAALGAGRWRIIRHLFTENMCLALLGGGAGAMLAFWAVQFIGPTIPQDLYRVGTIEVDGRALGFTLGASMAVAVLFGLAPAFAASHADLNGALRSGGRGASDSARRQRLHGLLVVSEISLAMVLAVSSVLAVRSFINMQDVRPGFNPAGVLTAEMILPDGSYETRASWNNFYDDALRRLETLPGVETAAAIYPLPLNFESLDQSFIPEGRPFAGPEDAHTAAKFWITPGALRTLEIPIHSGRDFTAFDDAEADRVVVINETMARRFWPDKDPIGRRIRLSPGRDSESLATIVGVAGDIKAFLMIDEPTAQFFVPQAQSSRNRRFFLIRTKGRPLEQVAALRSTIDSIDPGLPLTEVRSLREVVNTSMAMWGGAASSFGSLGFGALLLSAIGLYSLVAYSVRQRVQEIGVRIALGAQRRDIIGLVMRRGLILTGIGLTIGLIGALAVTSLLTKLLFDIGAHDPWTFVLTALILLSTALLACYLPTRRALQIDPMVALRSE